MLLSFPRVHQVFFYKLIYVAYRYAVHFSLPYTFSTLFYTVLFLETAYITYYFLVIAVYLPSSITLFATETGVRWCRQ